MDKTARRDLGVVVVVPIDLETGKFALVLDPNKPTPHYWKFPGGKVEPEDMDSADPGNEFLMACNAALRELHEETGLNATEKKMLYLGMIPKKSHNLYIFITLVDFADLVKAGEEGEKVAAFTAEETETMVDFFPNHRPIRNMALQRIRA